MALEYLLSWIAQEPWAIEPAKAREILAYITARAVGREMEEQAERMHPSRERAVRSRSGSVAVIPLHGVMAQRRLPGASTGGGTSTEAVGQAVDKAVADDAVKAIILDVDSPGGAVAGTRELAAKVLTARNVKPVIAQVDSVAASAAYWVSANATEVVATPGGEVGSIGVVAVHENLAGAMEKMGVSHTIISAGKYKAEGNPFGPLDDDGLEYYQGRVNEAYRDFVQSVASGRNVPVDTVEDGYGQGRVLSANKALAVGMIDRIATFEETLARFSAPKPSNQRRAKAARAIART